MGDSESSFPVLWLVIGPSMALFGRAQYNKAIKGNFYSRDFREAVLFRRRFHFMPRVDFTQNAEGDKLKVKITSRKRKIVTFALKFLSVSITQPCQLRSFKSCSDYCVGFTFASRSKKS